MTSTVPTTDILPGMAAAAGVAIVVARATGHDDPDDSGLYLPLSAAGFTSREIVDHLAVARAMAIEALRASVEFAALALFLGAVFLWLPVIAGA
mgnify:CR=1 FL=1